MGDLVLADKFGFLTGTEVSSSVWRFVRCRMDFIFQTRKVSPLKGKWLAEICYSWFGFL